MMSSHRYRFAELDKLSNLQSRLSFVFGQFWVCQTKVPDSIQMSNNIPHTGQEYILQVQREREQLPDWTRMNQDDCNESKNSQNATLMNTRGANIGKNLSESMGKNLSESMGNNCIPLEWRPLSCWSLRNLQRAVETRTALEKAGKEEAHVKFNIPLLNSKVETWKKWMETCASRPVAAISRLSQPSTLRLLELLSGWIEQDDSSTENTNQILNYSLWIFFLLCKCQTLLEADDQFTIRQLAKIFIEKRSMMFVNNDDGVLVPGPLFDEKLFASFTLCILIITKGWYGQKDLADLERESNELK